MDYTEFLKQKDDRFKSIGFNPLVPLNNSLFDFQKYIVEVALSKGRFAIFADCGLGKTLMALELAKQCYLKTGKPSLIFTPLSVVRQFCNEADKFKYDSVHEEMQENTQILVTNYEQLENLNLTLFGSIGLDESSILKNETGKTRNKLINSFSKFQYKFCYTATPSPNDVMEIGNHSAFLGIMGYKNMLSMYFINDMQSTQKWRLKKHAEDRFWQWVSSWAVCINTPGDLGFSNDGYILPELKLIEHQISTNKRFNGSLFNDVSVSATNHNAELKLTFDERMSKAIELSNSKEQCIVWVKHNEESSYLAKNIDGAVEVTGAMNPERKKDLLLGFAKNEYRVLVTKGKIARYGLNYQNCNNQIFASLDFSFEDVYQSIRRSYRFGQKKPVNVHLVTTDTMQNVIESIKRKQEQFLIMRSKLSKYAKELRGVQ